MPHPLGLNWLSGVDLFLAAVLCKVRRPLPLPQPTVKLLIAYKPGLKQKPGLQYKPGDEIDESEDENNGEVLVEADDDSDTDQAYSLPFVLYDSRLTSLQALVAEVTGKALDCF